MPRLPEHGDNSVHKPDAQTRAGTLYAQLAEQQLLAAAGRQHELGNLVRGSYAAAAALEYAQVNLFICHLSVASSNHQSFRTADISISCADWNGFTTHFLSFICMQW